MAKEYILPQGKKVFMYGLRVFYNIFFKCRTLFHISPAIYLSGIDVDLENNPNSNNPDKICYKYIAWSPELNYFYTLTSLRKNMDIPLMIYLPQNPSRFLPKVRDEINEGILKNKQKYKFIGILSIPFINRHGYLSNIYLYLFEKIGKRNVKNQLTGKFLRYVFLTSDCQIVSEGNFKPQHLTSYNEIAYLYYLSKFKRGESICSNYNRLPNKNNNENNYENSSIIKPYFYYDEQYPFIMVSINKDLNRKYTNLKKVVLEKWYQNGIKQLLFRLKEKPSLSKTNLQYLINNPNAYIMSTVNNFSDIPIPATSN